MDITNNNDNNNISLGTLYDLNKQILSKQEKMNQLELDSIKVELEEWFNWQIDGYAILLCRERYDFTIFHLYEKENNNPCEIAVVELLDVLKNRGDILSIEKDNLNNAWEIWININNEAFVYYLFNCDDWVIQC